MNIRLDTLDLMIVKRLLILAITLLCGMIVSAQGVDFQNLAYEGALEKAKAENKLVFMDCYTSWCGPCRIMSNEVFPQKEAGDYFNPLFVCVKYDMEKGEGPELAKQYGVRSYPTFLLIRPDGTVQHRIVGSSELPEFIERVERGLNKKTCLLYLDGRDASGKMKRQELPIYYQVLRDANMDVKADSVYKELISQLTEKDKLKAEYWFIVSNCRVGSKDFNLILVNLPRIEKNIGKEKLDKFLFDTYSNALFFYRCGRNTEGLPTLAELKTQIEALDLEQKQVLLDQYGLTCIVVAKDTKQFVVLFEQWANTTDAAQGFNLITASWLLDKEFTKADYARMTAAMEKVLATLDDSDPQKVFIEANLYPFQKKACVGIMFEDLTFEQALAKAQATRSMLFIDCYTSWCGPCRHMAENVFPLEKVGDFMNQFICVKYDMEKGEGPELAKKFKVQAYPTFVILNWDGTLRHKLVGSADPDEFMECVKVAFDDEKAFGTLQAKYESGNRDKAFLARYIQALLDAYDPDAPRVAKELFDSLTDEEKVSGEYWFLFSNDQLAAYGSEFFHYLLANHDKFVASLGAEKVDGYMASLYENKLLLVAMGNGQEITAESINRMSEEIKALGLAGGKTLLSLADIAKAALSGDQGKVLATCEREVKNMPGEKFPVILAVIMKDKATPAQIDRWVNVLRAAKDRFADKEKTGDVDNFINYLKK